MNISSSIRRLMQLFIVLFIALSGGLVYWQVVEASAVTANPHNGRKCLTENAPIRGRIFDRNGVLLAESVPAPNGGCGYVRKYTDPSLAGLIGYYVPGYPSPTGSIEDVYNNILDGQSGESALSNTVNSLLHQPPIGNDIYLTIDDRIQKVVNRDFDTPANPGVDLVFPSDRGSVVVTDPHTGQVLAMLSRPGYDPNRIVQELMTNKQIYFNQLNQNDEQPMLERPLKGLYVPGSIFKTVTLTAAIDSGHTTLNSQWNKKQALGPLVYRTKDGIATIPMDTNLGYPRFTFKFPISTQYAYANSDNIVFAQIGSNTGADTWVNYTKRMYFDQKVPFDLPVVESSVQNANGDPLSPADLATNAFGQGIDNVSPFQMSLVDNTVANNGVLMHPMLLLKFTDHNDNTVQSFNSQQLNTVASAQSATQVRQAMDAVARCGSGVHAPTLQMSPWGIIAKTGTGEVGGGKPAQAWMITQAPYTRSNPNQQPALTIVAMKENAGEGANNVGPMIAQMYQDIFSNNYVKAQAPVDALTNQTTISSYCIGTGLFQVA
jgi:peptidoglycan glycosyltransferase